MGRKMNILNKKHLFSVLKKFLIIEANNIKFGKQL